MPGVNDRRAGGKIRAARCRREYRRSGINRPRTGGKCGRRGAVYPPSYARKRGEITRYALKTPIYAVCIEKFFRMCYNASVNERAGTTAEHPLSQGAKCAFTDRARALPTASEKGADGSDCRGTNHGSHGFAPRIIYPLHCLAMRLLPRFTHRLFFAVHRCAKAICQRARMCRPSLRPYRAAAIAAPAAPRKNNMPRAFSDAPRRADVRFRTCRPLLTQKAICRYVPGRPARVRSHALPACADPRRICAYVQTTARRGMPANGRSALRYRQSPLRAGTILPKRSQLRQNRVKERFRIIYTQYCVTKYHDSMVYCFR